MAASSQEEVGVRASENGKPSLRYAWYVVFVLMACYTLSFTDRQVLSLLVGPIKRDLEVSDTRIGLLQSLAFALFYALMGLPLGRMADTRNRRNFIVGAVLGWSFFTAFCSAAKSFWSLFLMRIGVGVGEAGLSPAVYSLVSDYFPKERLAVALSVYSMGLYIGSSLALMIAGSIVDMLTRVQAVPLPLLGTIASWRVTFLVVGAPGLLFALLVFTIREPLRRSLLRNTEGKPFKLGLRETVMQMCPRWRSLLGVSLGMMFLNSVSYGFLAWAPTFFVRLHAWTPGQAGRALGPLILVFGCSGSSDCICS
jgi:MFS family permease